jgi:monothiol bacilliredoxin
MIKMPEPAEIKDITELDAALRNSSEQPVLLFKHSTTCPISARAYREYLSFLEAADTGTSYRLIIVQTARPVSNEVSQRLGIAHESPQAILIKNGNVIWDASHFEITQTALEEAVRGRG